MNNKINTNPLKLKLINIKMNFSKIVTANRIDIIIKVLILLNIEIVDFCWILYIERCGDRGRFV